MAPSNPAIKALRRLVRSAPARREAGVVVVEGPRPVAEAVAAGADVEAVYVAADRAELVDGVDVDVERLHPVAPGALDKVLSAQNPQPVAAVVRRPSVDAPVEELVGDPIVVLAGVGDPGNVGAVVRASVASGAGALVVGPGSADPFGPKAVRASAGSVFAATVRVVDDVDEALRALRASGRRLWGAAPRGGSAHTDVALYPDAVLVLGGETGGLPAGLGDDELVTIPQPGPVESLNVATAAAVLLFEAARRRDGSK